MSHSEAEFVPSFLFQCQGKVTEMNYNIKCIKNYPWEMFNSMSLRKFYLTNRTILLKNRYDNCLNTNVF